MAEEQHRVEVQINDSVTITYVVVTADDVVTIAVDGRDYVGLRMPGPDEPRVSIVTWNAEGDSTTTYPEGHKSGSSSV